MIAPEILERVMTGRGELVLRRCGAHLEVISNGVFLMDTRDGRSERLLVRAALDAHPDPRSVLIAGLGVGFSVVEAASVTSVSSVTVVEIEDRVVRWHDGPLAPVSGNALRDPRVQVVVADVRDHLRRPGPSYDVICLDVDNGPDWTVTEANSSLYGVDGTGSLLARLRPGGVLSVWSARAVPAYERLLCELGLHVATLRVDVPRGEPDVVYVARTEAP